MKGGWSGVAAVHGPKTHCDEGHPLSGANLSLRSRGERRCLTCHREQMRRSRARAAAA